MYSDNKSSLDSLQIVRAVAIILVVFHHSYNLILNYHDVNAPLLSVFEFGDMGVDLFFVLSGFIIFYVHQRDFGNKSKLKTYAYKRITRIFPVYWIVTFIFLCFVMFDRSPIHIIMSLLLIPTGEQPVLGVAWSLQHEMLFYALFALVIWSKRIFLPVIYAWFLVTVIVNVIPGIELLNPLTNLVLSPLNLEFLLGCLIAYVYTRHKDVNFGLFTTIGIFYILVVWVIKMTTNLELNPVLAWGIPAAFIILGLVSLERAGKFKSNKTLVVIGNASYSVYLIHVTCILIIEKISLKLGLYNYGIMINIIAVIAAIGSIFVGLLFYHYVEKPLLKYTKSKPFYRKRVINSTGIQKREIK